MRNNMRLQSAPTWRRLTPALLTASIIWFGTMAMSAQALGQDAAPTDQAKPAEPAPVTAPAEKPQDENPMLTFLFTSVTGIVLIVVYFAFVALLVWLAMDLRAATIMPAELVEALEDALNKRKWKEAFGIVQADNSLLGRVLTAGMTRMQHGLEEARDAAGAMWDSLKARKEHVLAYVAIIGTLGPLIGLVGTVSGMIRSFGELGRGGTPDPAKLAEGISHALNATLVGIFLSCMAIPAFSFFKNRLSRVTNDASLLVDDLLTQMYHSSRKAGGDGPPAPPPGKPGAPAQTSAPTKTAEG
jgi:biopolymer transport protein ExbB